MSILAYSFYVEWLAQLLKKRLLRHFIYPISKIYARLSMSGDQKPDVVMVFIVRIAFFIIHGYFPSFKHPSTFSEKLFYRMLFGRNPIWIDISDKLKVRNYVSERVGNSYLVPLLWKGKDPKAIPFQKLPEKVFIKTNHGSAYNIPVKNKNDISIQKIHSQLKKWLAENYGRDYALGIEWAYNKIDPEIMIEELLEENGKLPLDYKFFCFSGRVEYLLIVYDRFASHQEKHFTRDFVPLDLWNGSDQYPGPFIRPCNLEEMIRVAEKLSAGLDFIRVDLYDINGRIYFGELTCYPAGGLIPFLPKKWEYILGEKWNLLDKNQ